MSRRTAPRGGFTMIELLVVIAIIAILVSLTSVVVIKVRVKAKVAAAHAEIAQITNGIGSYKAKMNVGFIPSGGGGPSNTFRLCSSYVDKDGVTPLPWPEVIYLKQVFPGMRLDDNGLRAGGNFVSNGFGPAPKGAVAPILLDCNQTLVLFLTGGDATGFQGFSTNRAQPFETTATNRIGPFLDFPANKYLAGSQSGGAGNASALLDPWGSPYAYFAYNPSLNNYDFTQSYTFNGTTVFAYRDGNGRALNQKSFQVISAGDNGKDTQVAVAPGPPVVYAAGFGPGGTFWTPQAGNYAETMAGADDISNFNGGPLVIQN